MVLAVAAEAASVAVQVAVLEDPAVVGGWQTRLGITSLIMFWMYFIWRLFLNPYVSFGQHRLRVNNMFSRYLIPYHLITELAGRSALDLVVSGYGPMRVDALGAAPLTGKAKRDKVAQELLRRRAAAVPKPGHGFEKRFTIGLPECLGFGIPLTCFLVANFAAAFG
ncbi:hypothetical protein ACH4S8_04470 [Streptomyces sp. NPDC021080]|uniref:hypothetical protein n=1 Tax=Streptomyces sp. NPDC021080 TaxID=3365110 RepID=UPI0037B05BBF